MTMPIDKQYHISAGFAIALVFGIPYPLLGLGVAILAGVLKEIYDYFHQDRHTPDIYDFLATGVGGLLGFFAMVIYSHNVGI